MTDIASPIYLMSDVNYRPISRLAVASLISGLVSLAAFFEPTLLALAAVAMISAVAAGRAIQSCQLLGTRAVMWSWCVAVVIAVLVPTWHLSLYWKLMQQYEAEAQPNYLRLNFADLRTVDKIGLEPYEIRRVCLKGYFLDGDAQTPWPARRFSSNGDPQDQQAIIVIPPMCWSGGNGPVAVSGLLTIDRRYATGERRFVLRAAAIRESRTKIDLAPRKTLGLGGC